MILDKIIEATKIRVAQEKQVESPEAVKAAALALPSDTGFPFEAALRQQDFNFICEVKKASPSKGIIAEDFPYLDIAKEYEVAGAAAISVLTEPDFFKGDKKYLQEIASTVKIPVLRKDFIIDAYQIYEARMLGADAVLLIARILTPETLKRFLYTAWSLGMDALIEVHDRRDMEAALATPAEFIGINNRNLVSFTTSIEQTMGLLPYADKSRTLISESGVFTGEDARRLHDAGCDGILVGEGLVRADDVAAQTRLMANAGEK